MSRERSFDKDRELASRAGKKSKRPSFDKVMRDWMESATEITVKHKDGTEEKIKGAVGDIFRTSLVREAAHGNVQAIREGYNRAYGQAKQHIAINDETKSDEALKGASTQQLIAIQKILSKNKKP